MMTQDEAVAAKQVMQMAAKAVPKPFGVTVEVRLSTADGVQDGEVVTLRRVEVFAKNRLGSGAMRRIETLPTAEEAAQIVAAMVAEVGAAAKQTRSAIRAEKARS